MNSYMPDEADVVIVTKDGTTLKAHASQLLVSCKALAATPELFENHPVELQEPFSSYDTTVVVDFLACIYARGQMTCRLDVIKLAHALDATFLVRDALPSLETVNVHAINDVIEAASLCGWDDVKNAGVSQLIWLLEKPLDLVHPQKMMTFEPYYDADPVENASYSAGTMATRPFDFSNELLSAHVHLDSLAVAQKIVDVCSPETVTNVLQAFASAQRLHSINAGRHSFVTRNVRDYVTCIDRNVPSRMTCGEIGDTYAEYFDQHPRCSIEGDASAREMAIVAVFEIAALETGRTSMQFAAGPVRVSIRGRLEDGIASFSLVGQCESNRHEVSYTLVVPDVRHPDAGKSFTGNCIFGKVAVESEGVRVEMSDDMNVTVVCTIHEMREL